MRLATFLFVVSSVWASGGIRNTEATQLSAIPSIPGCPKWQTLFTSSMVGERYQQLESPALESAKRALDEVRWAETMQGDDIGCLEIEFLAAHALLYVSEHAEVRVGAAHAAGFRRATLEQQKNLIIQKMQSLKELYKQTPNEDAPYVLDQLQRAFEKMSDVEKIRQELSDQIFKDQSMIKRLPQELSGLRRSLADAEQNVEQAMEDERNVKTTKTILGISKKRGAKELEQEKDIYRERQKTALETIRRIKQQLQQKELAVAEQQKELELQLADDTTQREAVVVEENALRKRFDDLTKSCAERSTRLGYGKDHCERQEECDLTSSPVFCEWKWFALESEAYHVTRNLEKIACLKRGGC